MQYKLSGLPGFYFIILPSVEGNGQQRIHLYQVAPEKDTWLTNQVLQPYETIGEIETRMKLFIYDKNYTTSCTL